QKVHGDSVDVRVVGARGSACCNVVLTAGVTTMSAFRIPTCASFGQSKFWNSRSVHCGIACGLPTTPDGRLTVTSLSWSTGFPMLSWLSKKLVVGSAWAAACVFEVLVVNEPG